ncbi:hypothetical protein C7E23_14185 [Elizabethkingia anophelis]|nr:hypothetical protein C7E23_14185 [Elizabethkingia anophelis]
MEIDLKKNINLIKKDNIILSFSKISDHLIDLYRSFFYVVFQYFLQLPLLQKILLVFLRAI